MARIPQHTQTSARFAGVSAPPGAFQVATRAAARLMQDVGGSVDMVLEEGLKAQQIRNREDLRSRLTDMQLMREEFEQELQSENVDPSEWVPRWEKRIKEYESTKLTDGTPPPAVLEPLTARFDEFKRKSLMSINGAALKENKSRAKKGVGFSVEDMVSRGLYDEAIQAVRDNADLFTPEQVDGMVNGIYKKQKSDAREIALMDNPLGYRDALKAGRHGDLSPLQQRKEIEKAEREIAGRERKALSVVDDVIQSGGVETIEELDELLKANPEISDANAKIAKDSFLNSQPIPPTERYALRDKLFDDVNALHKGEIEYAEYKKRWEESNSRILAYGSRPNVGALKSVAYQFDPALMGDNGKDAIKASEDAAKAAQKDLESQVGELARKRATGLMHRTLAKIKPSSVNVDPKKEQKYADARAREEEQAAIFRERMEDEVLKWAATLPEPPTGTDVLKKMDEIQAAVLDEILQEMAEPGYTSQRSPVSGPQKMSDEAAEDERRARAEKWLSPN